MELLIVIIIVGVLGTLSVTHMFSAREDALEKEATTNLKLIIAAEKSYRLETDNYVSLTGVPAINQNLNLALSSSQWEYRTVADNAATPPTVSARAHRLGGATTFCIDQDDINATKGCAY